MEGLNILSLFDGISAGQVALERAGVKVNKYFASEIDKYAIKVTQHNYPNTIQLGDVRDVKGKDLPEIDLLMGGFCCQSFSSSGKQLGLNDPRGQLFCECVRLLKECNPRYFLFENVKMQKTSQEIITEALGVEPFLIDSALVSAQNRNRLYWTNIPSITLSNNKNVFLLDILDDDADNWLPPDHREYQNYNPDKVDWLKYPIASIQIGNSKKFGNAIRNTGKAYTLRATQCNGILDKNKGIRKFTPQECEKLQTIPIDYTSSISDNQRYKCLGNGWTVDVIAHIFQGIKNAENQKEEKYAANF